MAIDLRNPEGKYGGSAKSLAALMQIMESVKQKRRERDVSDKLLKGLNAGQTPDMLMASLAEPETKNKADLLTSLARTIVYPFNPAGTSRQETDLERGLKKTWISGKMDQAMTGKWGPLEEMAGGGIQQTHPVTGESKVYMPRSRAAGATADQQEFDNLLDAFKAASAGIGKDNEDRAGKLWTRIEGLLGLNKPQSMSLEDAGEIDAVAGAIKPRGGAAPSGPGFFGRLFGGGVENAPKGFEAFGRAGAPFSGTGTTGAAPKPKQPERAAAPQEDEELAAYYDLNTLLPKLDPETRRKVQELRNRGRKESDILKAVQQILTAKQGK